MPQLFVWQRRSAHAYPRCGSSSMMSVPNQERAAAGVVKSSAAGPRVRRWNESEPADNECDRDDEADEQATAKR